MHKRRMCDDLTRGNAIENHPQLDQWGNASDSHSQLGPEGECNWESFATRMTVIALHHFMLHCTMLCCTAPIASMH